VWSSKNPVDSSAAHPEFVACTVVAAPSPTSSDPQQILKSLHCLKVQERLKYKIIYTIYKVLQLCINSPDYLNTVITIQPLRSIRSSSLVTLLYPQGQSSLEITNCSFLYAAPHLCKKLPPCLAVFC